MTDKDSGSGLNAEDRTTIFERLAEMLRRPEFANVRDLLLREARARENSEASGSQAEEEDRTPASRSEGGSEYTTRHILDLIEASNGAAGLDLSGRNLAGLDLGYDAVRTELVKLHKKKPSAEPLWWSWSQCAANLEGVNLARANLRGACLEKANLMDASLEGADLSDASLKSSFLLGGKLAGALLWRANLDRVTLASANLLGANLGSARLWHARLSHAHLEQASLVDADLRGADLDWACLTDANLRRTLLTGVNLRWATVTNDQLAQARTLASTILPDGTQLSYGNWRTEFEEWRARREEQLSND